MRKRSSEKQELQLSLSQLKFSPVTMAVMHEVAPNAVAYSYQQYERLSTSSSNFAVLVSKLSYLDTKVQFKWFENFEELICLCERKDVTFLTECQPCEFQVSFRRAK